METGIKQKSLFGQTLRPLSSRSFVSSCSSLPYSCIRIAAIDIKGAYLQSGTIDRYIYVRLSKGWESSCKSVWKLSKPAYGLVESGRLWQLAIERWLSDERYIEVPALPQLFIERRTDGRIGVAIAKVFDDLLIVGSSSDLENFHEEITPLYR